MPKKSQKYPFEGQELQEIAPKKVTSSTAAQPDNNDSLSVQETASLPKETSGEKVAVTEATQSMTIKKKSVLIWNETSSVNTATDGTKHTSPNTVKTPSQQPSLYSVEFHENNPKIKQFIKAENENNQLWMVITIPYQLKASLVDGFISKKNLAELANEALSHPLHNFAYLTQEAAVGHANNFYVKPNHFFGIAYFFKIYCVKISFEGKKFAAVRADQPNARLIPLGTKIAEKDIIEARETHTIQKKPASQPSTSPVATQ